MYIVLCKKQASPFRQGDEYHMTIAHHWISEEQTIPTRYGRAVEEPIRRSSAPETGPRLARDTSHSVVTVHVEYPEAPEGTERPGRGSGARSTGGAPNRLRVYTSTFALKLFKL